MPLNWSESSFIVAINVAAQTTLYSIPVTKLYVLVVTLSTQDNAKLLEQLKSGLKRTILLSKYQPKVSPERPNRYLDFLIVSIFQGVNRIFVLPFENEAQWTSYKVYYLPTWEIKKCDVIINGQNFFHQPVRNDLITNDNIQKVATGQQDDYTTGCLINYNFFKNIIDLNKQQALDANSKATKKINFTGNLENNEVLFLLLIKQKELF